MQIYVISSKKLNIIQKYRTDFKPNKFKDYVYVSDEKEDADLITDNEKANKTVKAFIKNKHPRFESYFDFDIICLRLDFFATEKNTSFIFIYMQKNIIWFICEDIKLIQEFIDSVNERDEDITFGKILYLFMNYLISDDLHELESTEDDLTNLEQQILSKDSSGKNYSADAIKYIKKLRMIKQYYEQLINIAQKISGNENNLLDKDSLKYFQILCDNLDRLYRTATGLLDFAGEVREAYQMEADLRANKVMQLFTVITVIFLPLTLLVGWYGMNLKMPEYTYKYSYAIVIAVSIILSTLIIIYFKKRKWF